MRDDEQAVQARVPADFNAPDRVLWGLTARQVSILATVAALLWLLYQALTPRIPPVIVAIAALPIVALAAAVALGRRDGISMDRWLAAALAGARAPRRLIAASGGIPQAPGWAPSAQPVTSKNTTRSRQGPAPTAAGVPLRLPGRTIGQDGVVDLEDGAVALTAATTVTFDLRSVGEQHTLVGGMGRWLNALSGPVQIVVSTRRVDLHSHAAQIDDRLDTLPHPALADTAAGYAQFLRDLATERDPLDRRVLLAHPVGAHAEPRVARRAAEQTARALTGLGSATRVLDGGQVTDALSAACDPWRNVGTGRATPDAVITGGAP